MSTKYYRPSYVNVDLQAIDYNFKAIERLHPHKTVMAVVKANAYGLGAVQVAQYLMEQGTEFFAVATLDEAIELRMHGIKAKLLVLGIINPEDINKACRHRTALTIPGERWLKEAMVHLDETQEKPLWFHVKLDTGMNRIGIRDKAEYRRVIELIQSHDRFVFEGVFTHFSSADVENDSTQQAYGRFLELIDGCPRPPYIHAQNSAAALRYDMPECSAVRLGISMYGYYPSSFIAAHAAVKLKPAMQLISTVNFVKSVSAGSKVSYGETYTALEDEYIATLPIGYADGFLRSMQGYQVNIKGVDCEIVGRVCMDQTLVRVPASTAVGDQAILIHNQTGTHQSMEIVEQFQNTISYEVLCNLSRRLPRIYYGQNDHFIYNELLK